jgi:hypothetical protein
MLSVVAELMAVESVRENQLVVLALLLLLVISFPSLASDPEIARNPVYYPVCSYGGGRAS